MAFEVFTPYGSPEAIKPGTASINRDGRAWFTVSDLKRVGITTEATVLVDRLTRRIALRKPRAGETPIQLTTNKTKSAAKVRLTGVLKRTWGLDDATTVRGRFAVEIKEKDDLLYIVLPDAKEGGK